MEIHQHIEEFVRERRRYWGQLSIKTTTLFRCVVIVLCQFISNDMRSIAEI